ncbi:MAG: hypothetical protein ABIL12_07680 [candidate division WOR-3 bacterium]
MKEIKELIEGVIKGKKTGILRVYRKMFGDPLLYVTFLKGTPVYAYSFLVKEKWYDGLLSYEEVENNLFGNLFEYAFKKHGQKYVEHLVVYSNRVIQEALTGAVENNWQLEAEFIHEDEDTVRESIGILKVKSEIEAFAKTLQSLGAKEIFIPKLDKFIGYYAQSDLRDIYNFMVKAFGDCDNIFSSPFGNIFIIHKYGQPVVFSMENVLIGEDVERLISIIEGSEKVLFGGKIEGGQRIEVPVFKTYGKPFLISLRTDEGFLTLHLKSDKVYMMDVKPTNAVFSTISEYNEKISIALYDMLGKETKIKSQDIVDMRIKILLMKYPNPQEFKEVVQKERF